MGKRFYVLVTVFMFLGLFIVLTVYAYSKYNKGKGREVGALPTYFNRVNQQSDLKQLDNEVSYVSSMDLRYDDYIITIPTFKAQSDLLTNYTNEVYDKSGEFFISFRESQQEDVKEDIKLDDNSRVISYHFSGIKEGLLMQVFCFTDNAYTFFNTLQLRDLMFKPILPINFFKDVNESFYLKEPPKIPVVLKQVEANTYDNDVYSKNVIRTKEDLINDYFVTFLSMGYPLNSCFYSEDLLYLKFEGIEFYASRTGYNQYNVFIRR